MNSALLPVLAACAAGLCAQDPPTTKVETLITAQSIAGPLRFLSHDLLEGRGVGTRGDELARVYLATQLQLFGLEPGGPDGAWEQPVPMVGITSQVDGALRLSGQGGTLELRAPDEFLAVAGDPNPEGRWADAEVVFVGYGIHAPEQKWDDFKGLDVRGKVLLVLNNDPAGDPELFAGKTRLYYGRWTYKYEEAARRGAAGVLLIHTTPSAGYSFHVLQARHGKEEPWLPFTKDEPTMPVRGWIVEDAAKRLCTLGGHDLDALRARAEAREFAPVALNVRAGLRIANTVREFRSANVIGRLPGADPTVGGQAVVVTAHFDHLGVGQVKKGDGIYNGALDNASGCAVALNLARACAALPERPRRTLLFVFVTAEESGLLGSLWFARNPTVPVKDLIANFNLDSVNVWGPTEDVQLVGHGKSDLTALVEQVAARRGRRVEPDAQVDLGLFYRSDHFSLARVGVPSAYFKSGDRFLENREGRARLKASYTTVHYHQPSDQYDPRMNLHGAAEDARLVLECLVRCANADAAPRWTPGDEFEKLR